MRNIKKWKEDAEEELVWKENELNGKGNTKKIIFYENCKTKSQSSDWNQGKMQWKMW